MLYKCDKKGNEFYNYKKNKPVFMTNEQNDQIYARDVNGNEIYPKRGIAKDRYYNYHYAKDAGGNEYYPSCKKFDIMITKKNGDVLIAKLNSMKQRYPKDKHGNEFYPIDRNDRPFYLINEYGRRYYGRNKFNSIVPLNNHVYKKTDALGNKIYTTKKKLDLTLLVCLESLPLILSIVLALVI